MAYKQSPSSATISRGLHKPAFLEDGLQKPAFLRGRPLQALRLLAEGICPCSGNSVKDKKDKNGKKDKQDERTSTARRRSRAGCSRGTALTTAGPYVKDFADITNLLKSVEQTGRHQAFSFMYQENGHLTNMLF